METLRAGLAAFLHRGGPEFRLPRIIRLAEELGVSRQSVRKAYRRLEHSGLIRHGARLWENSVDSKLKLFGMVLPESFSRFFVRPQAAWVYRVLLHSGLADRAAELGCGITPVQLPPPDAGPEEMKEVLAELRHYRGIVHFGDRGFDHDLPLRMLLCDREIPQVSLYSEFNIPEVGAITIDPGQIADTVVRYLHESGHFKIGVVYVERPEVDLGDGIRGGRATLNTAPEIEHFFRKAGLEGENFVNIQIPASKQIVRDFEAKLDEVLAAPDPPSAFWCRSDVFAVLLIKLLRKRNFRVPEHFSVIGFGNYIEAKNTEPSLTSLCDPCYEMGRGAIDRLMLFRKQGVTAENRRGLYPVILVARDSVDFIGEMEKQKFDLQDANNVMSLSPL